MKFESVIWDWNGTLLSDVGIAVAIINQLLEERALKPISPDHYLEVFTFPVSDYYEQIGFDLKNEPFEIPAFQYITYYNKSVQTCGLHPDALPALQRLQNLGCRQFILSAMEQQQLEKTIAQNEISAFFEDLCGLNHHFATSKVEIGRNLIVNRQLHPGQTLLIGDTIHDFEVAQAIGCNCILIANGHQSKKRLLNTGAIVLNNLDEIEFS